MLTDHMDVDTQQESEEEIIYDQLRGDMAVAAHRLESMGADQPATPCESSQKGVSDDPRLSASTATPLSAYIMNDTSGLDTSSTSVSDSVDDDDDDEQEESRFAALREAALAAQRQHLGHMLADSHSGERFVPGQHAGRNVILDRIPLPLASTAQPTLTSAENTDWNQHEDTSAQDDVEDSAGTVAKPTMPARDALALLTASFPILLREAQSVESSPAKRAAHLGSLQTLIASDAASYPVLSVDPSSALRAAQQREASLKRYSEMYITAMDALAVPPDMPEYTLLIELAAENHTGNIEKTLREPGMLRTALTACRTMLDEYSDDIATALKRVEVVKTLRKAHQWDAVAAQVSMRVHQAATFLAEGGVDRLCAGLTQGPLVEWALEGGEVAGEVTGVAVQNSSSTCVVAGSSLQPGTILANVRRLPRSALVDVVRQVVLVENPTDTERHRSAPQDWAEDDLAALRRFGPAWDDRRDANFSYDTDTRDERPYSELSADEQLERETDRITRDTQRSNVVANEYDLFYPSSRNLEGEMTCKEVFVEYGPYLKARAGIQAVLKTCGRMSAEELGEDLLLYAQLVERTSSKQGTDKETQELTRLAERLLKGGKANVLDAMRAPEEIAKLIEACEPEFSGRVIEETSDGLMED